MELWRFKTRGCYRSPLICSIKNSHEVLKAPKLNFFFFFLKSTNCFDKVVSVYKLEAHSLCWPTWRRPSSTWGEIIISATANPSVGLFLFLFFIFCGTQVHKAAKLLNLDLEQRLLQVQSVFLFFFFLFPREQRDLYNFIKGRSLKHVSFIK